MPEDVVTTVAVIVGLFALFSVVLAWADHRTRRM
jgi:hypothetical protein